MDRYLNLLYRETFDSLSDNDVRGKKNGGGRLSIILGRLDGASHWSILEKGLFSTTNSSSHTGREKIIVPGRWFLLLPAHGKPALP